MYVFTQAPVEFPILTEVTIVRGTSTLTVDKILVRNKLKAKDAHKQRWIPLKDWLLGLPVPDKLTEGDNRFGEPRIMDCQRRWWRNNGKRFPILNLPAELRALIYLHALRENIYPVMCPISVGNQSTVCLGRPNEDQRSRGYFQVVDACERLDPPNYSTLALSKGTRIEVLKAAWQGTWKNFCSPYSLHRVMNVSITPNHVNWLTRVHVNFTVHDYFRELGVDMDPIARFQTPMHGAGQIFQNILGLNHLELCFPGAQDPTFAMNPWTY